MMRDVDGLMATSKEVITIDDVVGMAHRWETSSMRLCRLIHKISTMPNVLIETAFLNEDERALLLDALLTK